MRFLKTLMSAKFIGLSLSIATLATSPSWAADEASFKSYKAASAIGEDFVIETHRCGLYFCYWRTARVLEDLRFSLFDLGHKKAGHYPDIDTTDLLPWVVHEYGVDIHLSAGKIAAVDVEHFNPTDNSSCPFEAQIKYRISNSGVSNPIAGVMSQIFEADNQEASDDELFVTVRECFKQDAGGWKQTRWGYYLRES